jgi:adenine-specific DNA methylase
MWAIEYHCNHCKRDHHGRFFKKPGRRDLGRFSDAASAFSADKANLPIPEDEIPAGDETARLHRWGYRRYCEMFNERQLLGLGVLLQRLRALASASERNALLTVFSDFLRYENMLCRYDTYALKCQDIFAVHGFPVGLVQCENSVLGTPCVGSGSFRHFVEKYLRAKDYCVAPFETRRRQDEKRRAHCG